MNLAPARSSLQAHASSSSATPLVASSLSPLQRPGEAEVLSQEEPLYLVSGAG